MTFSRWECDALGNEKSALYHTGGSSRISDYSTLFRLTRKMGFLQRLQAFFFQIHISLRIRCTEAVKLLNMDVIPNFLNNSEYLQKPIVRTTDRGCHSFI